MARLMCQMWTIKASWTFWMTTWTDWLRSPRPIISKTYGRWLHDVITTKPCRCNINCIARCSPICRIRIQMANVLQGCTHVKCSKIIKIWITVNAKGLNTAARQIWLHSTNTHIWKIHIIATQVKNQLCIIVCRYAIHTICCGCWRRGRWGIRLL